MTSFVHITYPTQHPGVVRFETGLVAFRRAFSGSKGLTAMVLAAVVSALLVLADQMVDTWADGHLLAAWVTLWVVAFAALALLAPMVGRLTRGSLAALDAWSHRVARARADERLWVLAQQDPRVLADLQVAIMRSEAQEPPVGGVPAPAAKRISAAARRAAPNAYLTWYL